MSDCLFCKIIQGELPSYKVYEDEKILAFLDIFPVRKGHVLVVPKVHARTLTESPPEMTAAIGAKLPELARAVMKGTNAEGLNMGVNCEAVGGQHVFHLHFHLIPRHANDGLRTWPTEKYSEGEIEKYGAAIRSAI